MDRYRVYAWRVKTDKFDGLVYSQKIAIDKLAEGAYGQIDITSFVRDHKPMDHMTYHRIGV